MKALRFKSCFTEQKLLQYNTTTVLLPHESGSLRVHMCVVFLGVSCCLLRVKLAVNRETKECVAVKILHSDGKTEVSHDSLKKEVCACVCGWVWVCGWMGVGVQVCGWMGVGVQVCGWEGVGVQCVGGWVWVCKCVGGRMWVCKCVGGRVWVCDAHVSPPGLHHEDAQT